MNLIIDKNQFIENQIILTPPEFKPVMYELNFILFLNKFCQK